MRIGIDFDNTIICYDEVFCQLAKSFKLVPEDYQGSKRELRQVIQNSAEGDLAWQRLQGKAYGEGIGLATLFPHFKDFINECTGRENVELFIVSHKTELGHFDEKRINLRDAARQWLRSQGLIQHEGLPIPETHLYFESTREAKIKRIRALGCTHFIDDLPEVLFAAGFPESVQRFLFQPDGTNENVYKNWIEIKNAIFTQ